MKAFIYVCWFAVLLVILSLGFRAIIWYLIIPITVTLAQIPWLEFAINIVSVICSLLFVSPIKLSGGKL